MIHPRWQEPKLPRPFQLRLSTYQEPEARSRESPGNRSWLPRVLGLFGARLVRRSVAGVHNRAIASVRVQDSQRCPQDPGGGGQPPELEWRHELGGDQRRGPRRRQPRRRWAGWSVRSGSCGGRRSGFGVGALAAAAGTVAALRELIRIHYHSTAERLVERARAAAAERLLLTTRRPLALVGKAAGYADRAAFEVAFRREVGLAPVAYRRLRGSSRFTIGLPRRFTGEAALAHVGRDGESSSERVDGLRAEVGVRVGGAPAALALDLRGGRLRGKLTARRRLPAGAAAEGLEIARRLLGLATDPAPFERRVARRPRAGGARRRPPRAAHPARPRPLRLPAVGDRRPAGQPPLRVHPPASRLRAGGRAGRGRAAGAAHPAGGRGPRRRRPHPPPVLARARPTTCSTPPAPSPPASCRSPRWRGGRPPAIEPALLARRGLGPWSTHYVMMRGFGLRRLRCRWATAASPAAWSASSASPAPPAARR